jgi:nitroimidazol reductase NimA-like FMN-containing flavoprotein (pyridoxamine 5'-phosphate oxidase superfamily)
MFREMRRRPQALSREEIIDLLKSENRGVMSVQGDDGYPYGVPLSYVYVDGETEKDEAGFTGRAVFYFHCAKTGHKIDALRACDKACFTIIDRDDVVADEFTTYFRSVVAFGHAKILETREEMMPAIQLLARRYSPDESEDSRNHEIEREFPGLAMIEFTVDHMTGKEAIELVRKREQFGE